MKSWKSSTPQASMDDIVFALRRAGASVQRIDKIGAGCPALLVGYEGENYLLADSSDTPATKAWQSRWGGSWSIVRSISDALDAIGTSNDE